MTGVDVIIEQSLEPLRHFVVQRRHCVTATVNSAAAVVVVVAVIVVIAGISQ